MLPMFLPVGFREGGERIPVGVWVLTIIVVFGGGIRAQGIVIGVLHVGGGS